MRCGIALKYSSTMAVAEAAATTDLQSALRNEEDLRVTFVIIRVRNTACNERPSRFSTNGKNQHSNGYALVPFVTAVKSLRDS